MKMFIMVGVPGSGKSHKARNIAKQLAETEDNIILSTDSLFETLDSYFEVQYLWTPTCLREAHLVNLCKTKVALSRGLSVIIDNTNITQWQRQPYIDLAAEFGIEYELVEPDTAWKYDAQECAKRNKHGVPLASIEKMLKELQC